MGIRVWVTGPLVLNSRTMDSAGAGAVARAMPPNTRARYTGTSVNQNTTPNTSETTAKVPSDWVRVVMMMALPERLILFQTSSVPIIRPTLHSKTWTSVSYHAASSISWLTRDRAWGPESCR